VTSPSAPDSAFTEQDFHDIYPPGIEHHYWNHARNQIVHSTVMAVIGRQPDKPSTVLDVGCGTGIVTGYLRRRGIDCWGCDLGTAPPIDALTAPFLSPGIDATDLAPAFRHSVGVILLLDVLEHLEHPAELLGTLRRAFPRLHTIVVTVPARRDLWSNYDVRNRHFRRYQPETLHDLVPNGEFRLVEWRYFFHALYPAARALLALRQTREEVLHAPQSRAARALHRVVASLFLLESRVLPRRLPGSSLLAVLQRIND